MKEQLSHQILAKEPQSLDEQVMKARIEAALWKCKYEVALEIQ